MRCAGPLPALLRGRYGFDGVVCTDWQLIKDLDNEAGLLQSFALRRLGQAVHDDDIAEGIVTARKTMRVIALLAQVVRGEHGR